MARRGKNSAASGVVIIIGLVLAALASIPVEAWEVMGVVLGIIFFLWILFKLFAAEKKEIKSLSKSEREFNPGITISLKTHETGNEWNEPVKVTRGSGNYGYRISPTATLRQSKARWVARGETVAVQGFKIDSGLFYLGQNLNSPNGNYEPALIDPTRPVLDLGSTNQPLGYWPNYRDITAEARWGFLRWMATGRNDPAADIGYVFLFFYGLERRAIVDVVTEPDARKDIPQIINEVRSLLSIYSGNHSFQNYAKNFLHILDIQASPDKIFYENETPTLTADLRELPASMRVGLGQLAASGKLVPSQWAYCWAFVLAEHTQRKRVLNCTDVFEKLFAAKYKEAFGDGLKLPANKTKLKLMYNAASSGIRGIAIPIPQSLPDVTATSLGLKKLLPIMAACAEELAPYSRFVTRNADQANSLAGLLQLPISLWPESIRSKLERIKSQIGNEHVPIKMGELAQIFKDENPLNRNLVLGLARALESMQIGMEPDVLAGAKAPEAEETIVLFTSPAENPATRSTTEYKTATLIIELASAVAHADGDFSQPETAYLSGLIDTWQHLSLSQRNRLKAFVRLQMTRPDKLSGLKKKLEPLTPAARQSVALYSVRLAQADGVVTASEVKVLEKIYKSLGIETQKLYSDLHTTNQFAPPSIGGKDTALDQTRIAALRKETEQVSTLLAGVFIDDEDDAAQDITESTKEDAGEANNAILPGLDAEHRAFFQVLYSRPSWTRAELLDVAADMKVLLDGALERINEAALDHFGEAVCEGDDPVEINTQLMEKLAA